MIIHSARTFHIANQTAQLLETFLSQIGDCTADKDRATLHEALIVLRETVANSTPHFPTMQNPIVYNQVATIYAEIESARHTVIPLPASSIDRAHNRKVQSSEYQNDNSPMIYKEWGD